MDAIPRRTAAAPETQPRESIMNRVARIWASIRKQALAPEPTPVYLLSFLGIAALLFVAAYHIGQ